MCEQFQRTEMQLGKEKMNRLFHSHVAVFGIGGVGGYCAEALARSGIGSLSLIDKDKVSITNINRQIIATHDTLGQYKTDVMKNRILSINPQAKVSTYPLFYTEETSALVEIKSFDFIVDAIDTITSKISLIVHAKQCGVPIISAMGAANKMMPNAFIVDDIYNTRICPLAKVMRKELRKRGIGGLKVVYSQEEPLTPHLTVLDEFKNRPLPSSNAFVPPSAGLLIASEVVKMLLEG